MHKSTNVLEMSNVWVAKFVSMVIIFAGSLICGLIPAFRCFATFPRYRLSLVLSFGGGILIATSLIHILPEVSKVVRLKYEPSCPLKLTDENHQGKQNVRKKPVFVIAERP